MKDLITPSEMNGAQKLVFVVAIILVAVITLYPPGKDTNSVCWGFCKTSITELTSVRHGPIYQHNRIAFWWYLLELGVVGGVTLVLLKTFKND